MENGEWQCNVRPNQEIGIGNERLGCPYGISISHYSIPNCPHFFLLLQELNDKKKSARISTSILHSPLSILH